MPTEADFPSDLRALEGEYELIRELGHGGMAAVYLARKRVSGRLVAIKAIRARYLDDEDALQRFTREARTVADLNHPNIVQTEAIEQIDDRAIAIIMEHVPGGTVRDRLREHGALGAEHAENVLRDVATALAYAHQRGIVHRDVKPENVFLDSTGGRALLSDFGIARRIDGDIDITLLGAALGTPQYMSPEQIDGGQLDGRSDIYSLGVLGWEILTGRRPWAGESLYGIIYKQKHEDLPRITSLRPRVPANLLFAIEGALIKDRTKRWQSAGEFLERLTYNPPPVLAQDYPAGSSSADDQPTVHFRRTELVPPEPDGSRPLPDPPVHDAEPVVHGDESATTVAYADTAEGHQPFSGTDYTLPEFGPNAETSFEGNRARARVLRGLALLAPLAIAGVSLFVVLGGSTGEPSGRTGTVKSSGGTVATAGRAIADSSDSSRPVPAIPVDSTPAPVATPGEPMLLRPPSSPTPGPVLTRSNVVSSREGRSARSTVTAPRAAAETARARTNDDVTASRRATDTAVSSFDATVEPTRQAAVNRDAPVDSASPTADSIVLENPFRPPTVPPVPGRRARGTPRAPSGAVPTPRCRIASTADQRVCLQAYVSAGDAPMQRAFDALVIELRRLAGVASGAPDPTNVHRVRVEQRAWLSVRGGECRREPTADDGPFWAEQHAQCYNEMAAARARELQDAVRRLRRR